MYEFEGYHESADDAEDTTHEYVSSAVHTPNHDNPTPLAGICQASYLATKAAYLQAMF